MEIEVMSNQQLEEMQEKQANEKLAAELGISYEELLELEWTIETNEGHDGAVYGYTVIFSEESPREILDKIEDLDDHSVNLSPSFFNEHENDE